MRKTLKQQIYSLIREPIAAPDVARQYQLRLKDYRLTRDENPESHFCVYFAAFNPKRKEVFIGHHKKSNLWLFSGGHIDQGETIEEAVAREIWEEWGQRIPVENIPAPSLLTITDVVTPNIVCKIHFDIWHFFPVEKERFAVDQSKIAKEFHEIGWHRIENILDKITDLSTTTAISKIEKLTSSSS